MRLLILLTFLLASCVPGARYSLQEDNDLFKPGRTKDRDFTQGVRFSGEVPDVTGSTVYAVGQNFYTPGSKQLTTPQPHDRPYAGFLYAKEDFKYLRTPTLQDTVGVTAGIVGPHSYSEQAQNEVHRLIGDNTAKGWDNQIHDEPGLMLTFQRDKAVPLSESLASINTIGVNAGNVLTQVYAGSVFRVGINPPPYFDSGDIVFPRMPQPTESTNSLRLFAFAGPWVRGVARNIFLDGNTFRDSMSIGKKPFVAEVRAGLGAQYAGYRLAYTYVYQTKEFDGQKNTTDFGEIALSLIW